MNFYLGLRRVSAVFWGFIALLLFFSVLGATAASGADRDDIWRFLGGATVSLLIAIAFFKLMHGITKWILAGFFGDKSSKE